MLEETGKKQITPRLPAPERHLKKPLKKGPRIWSHAGLPLHQLRELGIYTIVKADFDPFLLHRI